MAFPSYTGYAQQQPQQYYQPQYQQQQSNVQGLMTVTVQGEAGASIYPVAAGNTVILMDFSGGMFWVKSTDTNGIPQPMRSYKFVEEVKKPPVQIDSGADYASKQELDELKGIVSQLIDQLKTGGAKVNDSSTTSNVVTKPASV